jgi:hypothetical protein
MEKLKKTIMPMALSLVSATLILFPSNPSVIKIPSRDSGVFLYIGWRLLNGEIPYRDVWDHKPPLIYFTDAFGLSLSPNSLWGVWLLQLAVIALILFVTYKVVEKVSGMLPALFSIIILSTTLLSILDKGNYTEEYALLFQAICFWLILKASTRDFPTIYSLLIGLAGGIAFYYKQTTIGVCLAYGLLLIWYRFSKKNAFKLLLDFLYLGMCVAAISIGIVAFFSFHHALYDFWDQAFVYNFSYINKNDSITNLFPLFIKGFAFLSNSGIIYYAFIGWILGAIFILKQEDKFKNAFNILLITTLIDFPIEIFMVAVSGRSILHYYLTPLAVMAILSAYFAYAFLQILSKIIPLKATKQKIIPYSIILVAILISQAKLLSNYSKITEQFNGPGYQTRTQVGEYIINNTNERDYVLFLGAETNVNFVTRRVSPTRYVYQYPLALTGSRSMTEEFFSEILDKKPTLIVDTRGYSHLGEKLYTSIQKRSPFIQNAVQVLEQSYHPVATYNEWIVYKRAIDTLGTP